MRPHIELIHHEDYVWHAAELPRGEGRARERRLAVDEEDGSSSLEVEFLSDWGRPGGVHHADTEYFVLTGELEVAGQVLGPGGYLRSGKGIAAPAIKAPAGTRILHWREYGAAGFDAEQHSWPQADGQPPTVLDAGQLPWQDAGIPGPRMQLRVKVLHHDPKTDFYTRLFWAPPGWGDERLAHHMCFEEAFTLEGRMEYNLGVYEPGTYFFRPPRIKHGQFAADASVGCKWIIRSDGELTNYYTTDTWIDWGGIAENYDQSQAPVVSTFPVRSRSCGPWSGAGM